MDSKGLPLVAIPIGEDTLQKEIILHQNMTHGKEKLWRLPVARMMPKVDTHVCIDINQTHGWRQAYLGRIPDKCEQANYTFKMVWRNTTYMIEQVTEDTWSLGMGLRFMTTLSNGKGMNL